MKKYLNELPDDLWCSFVKFSYKVARFCLSGFSGGVLIIFSMRIESYPLGRRLSENVKFYGKSLV